jgi:predicted phosphodiesterase
VKTLTLDERLVPDGSLIAVLSDIHIPYADEDAVKLAIECCEREGVTHVILNGDIADCGPASRHESKRKRAVLDEGCLRESVAAGLWIYEWARTRQCYYALGNHEQWVDNYIRESPELLGTPTTELMGLWDDGDGWTVLPPMGRIRLGSRGWEHGHAMFKGGGGLNPGARMRRLAPNQSTSIGHTHQKFASFWTSYDEEGVPRTHAAFGNGHLSITESHEDYAGGYTNWQKSFELTRVYYVDGRPRFTTYQPEIFTDRRGKPYLEHGGYLYR